MANDSKFVELEKIVAESSGASDKVLADAETALQTQHAEKITGRYHTSDAGTVKTTYTVTIQPKEGEAKTVTSDKSYDDALAQATDGGKIEYDQANVKLSLEREVEVPYHLVTTEAKCGNKRELMKQLADEEKRLADRYGQALVVEPEDRQFHVAIYSKGSGTFKQIMQRIGKAIKGTPIAEATKPTLDEAIAAASESADSRSRVYKGTFTYKVYGHKEGTAPKTRTGGSGAIFTPEYEPATALY